MIKKTRMIKRTYYLPTNLIEEITAHSNLTGLSTSDIIRISAKEYLKREARKI
jgi:hypothetical protein